jgi:hypothetical protein
MKNRFIKFAATVAPAALLLAAGTPADAKVLVMGDGGWEVSFDGSVNGFFTHNSPDAPPTMLSSGPSGSFAGFYGPDGFRQDILGGSFARPDPLNSALDPDTSRIQTGLLPAVFAINIKAPTTGGLDMASRIGFYPQINNATHKNQFSTGTDGDIQAGAQIDLREIFFTVDGSFGQVLVGRTLSHFLFKNILTDMTLFGVGAGAGPGIGTTLGRIGWGYVYPNFNARIQYTTPDMNGFKVSAGMYDPSVICGRAGANCATEVDTPRLEGEASYAGSMGGADVSAWISGLWQDAEYVGVKSTAVASSDTAVLARRVGEDVTSWGFGGGLVVGFAGFELTGSGYVGEALGTTLMMDFNSLDFSGAERDNYGFIGQGTYTFAGTTKVGFSYGQSSADESDNEEFCRLNGTGATTANGVACTLASNHGIPVEDQSAWVVGIYHNINPNLLFVVEYTRQEVEWHDGADQDVDIFGIGGFFFW